MEVQVAEAVQGLHQAAEKLAGKPVQAWLPVCPLPTGLCRVSPFFPMDKGSLPFRDYLENLVITEIAWGRISYTGSQLSTYDEDALMAILALLDNKFSRQENFSGRYENLHLQRPPFTYPPLHGPYRTRSKLLQSQGQPTTLDFEPWTGTS